MGGSHRPYRRGGRVTFDWMLIVIGLMAGALLAGTVIRTEAAGRSSQFGTHIGGLRVLSDTDRLVVFEDFSSGIGGWSGGVLDTDHLGLGAIWRAAPADVPLSREIVLPAQTVRAVLTFDIIAIDDWALEGVEVLLGDTVVLEQRFSSRPDLAEGRVTETPAVDGVTLVSHLDTPRELGFGAGGPQLQEERLSVQLAVTTPGQALTLTLRPVAAEEPGEGPAPNWAVDNLIVVSESLP